MKKTNYLLTLMMSLFLMKTTKMNAQTYVPFPDSGTIWVNTVGEWLWQPGNPIPTYNLIGVKEYCMPGADTVINSNTYSQLFYCGGNYKGGLREVNQKIMYFPADSAQEYLLYDFSAQPGDTINEIFFESPFDGMTQLGQLILPNIGNDSVEVNGQYRLRIAGVWISGIGNHQGLFFEHWPNVSNYQLKLECMSIEDTTYYPQYGVGSCPTVISKIPSATMEEQNMVYPNPAENLFFVELKEEASNVQCSLSDLAGKNCEVYLQQQGNKLIVELNDLPKGVYLLQIKGKKGLSTQKIIKQ